MRLYPLTNEEFSYNSFIFRILRKLQLVTPMVGGIYKNRGEGPHTTCMAFARQSSQKPLSFMSMYSTAWDDDMAQRYSWQWVRWRVCPSSCTHSMSRRLASRSRSAGGAEEPWGR